MKKLLVLAALTMAAAPALASKARISALGNSAQLVDAQTIFTRPSNLVSLGSWATVELGSTAPAAGYGTFTNASGTYAAPTTAYAEGGFSRSFGDAYLGFYMGHHDDQVAFGRAVATAGGVTGALSQENPIDIYYAAKMGDMSWGAGIWYSSSDKKATSLKQSAMGVRASVEVANADAYVSYGITDSAENSTVKYTGSTPITLGGGYALDAWYFFADMTSQEGKIAAGTDTKFARSSYRLGAVNTTKGEGSNFFWGVSYEGYSQGKDITSVQTTGLPFIMGLEHDAASWLTLRGSVKQTVILSSTKTGTADVNTQDNNTTAAAGVGVKFNKLVLDASIAKAFGTTARDGDINGNNFMSNAALTYMF